MTDKLTETGIPLVGEVPWGTHFCLLYQTAQDLADILVPYFEAGLENNEYCVCATSEPLEPEELAVLLRKQIKNFDAYAQKGQLQIVDYSQWYTDSGLLENDAMVQRWIQTEAQAIQRGLEGLRFAANTPWLREEWKDFPAYEAAVDAIMAKRRMLGICSYALYTTEASQVLDLIHCHSFALIEREGKCELVASSEGVRTEQTQRTRAEARLAEQLTLINQVRHTVASTLKITELCETVVEAIQQSLAHQIAAVFSVQGQKVSLEAAAGASRELLPPTYTQKLGEGIVGWVAQSGEALLANDVTQEPRFAPLGRLDIGSQVGVPIKRGEKTIGVLAVASERRGVFSDSDVLVLKAIADELGRALEKALLHHGERHRRRQRETIAKVGEAIALTTDPLPALPRALDLIVHHLGYSYVHLFEVDAEAGQAVFKAGTGEAGRVFAEQGLRHEIGEESIIGSVAQSGQPLLANDVNREPRYPQHPPFENICSQLAVPIHLRGQIIGVLDAGSEELNAFGQSDLDTLETLAAQFAMAMENARLHQEAHRCAVEHQFLLDTAHSLASSLDHEEALQTMAGKVKGLTQAAGSRIYLVEPDGKALQAIVVLEDSAEEILATPVRIGEGVIGQVAISGAPQMINDPERDPGCVPPLGMGQEAHALMCVPLAVRESVIGVMTLSRGAHYPFTDTDLRLVTSIASQAATAIEHARLLQETKRLAVTDPLTGVWNRRRIAERLRKEVSRVARSGRELSVLVMDIDNLKLFNHTHGHLAGDKVIRTVARVILSSRRDIDVVGRYGGDEFAVLLPYAGPEAAATVAERILAALKDEHFEAPSGIKVPISISIGIACYPSDTDEVDRLFSLADSAMYRAKVAGGDQFASVIAEPETASEGLGAPFDVLKGLLITVDAKDHYTFKHSQEVTRRASALARALGLSEDEVKGLETASGLHDVGKIGVRTDVLRKPGPLSPDEWTMIHQHPRLGHMLLHQVPEQKIALRAVLHHHERYDGMGYPDGLSGEEIPLLARVLAVADAFSAMMTDRPYRKALTLGEALDELRRNAGKQFDPEVANKFIRLVKSGEIV